MKLKVENFRKDIATLIVVALSKFMAFRKTYLHHYCKTHYIFGIIHEKITDKVVRRNVGKQSFQSEYSKL